MSERQRQELAKFLKEYEKEEAELAERLERPLKLKSLQDEISKNTRKLTQLKRRQVLGIEERPFIPDDLYSLSFDTQEAFVQWTRLEARAFFDECQPHGWTGKPEHVNIIVEYFQNRDIGPGKSFPFIDRRMWKAAWLSLRKDGVFENEPEIEKPAPVVQLEPQEESFDNLPRLPLGHSVSASWKEVTEGAMGYDPETGLEKFWTGQQIKNMDAETYKRAFRLRIPALTKANFGR